jgi:hypothetical protein
MESNQTAARAAKRFLQDRVRTDWAFPDAPPAWAASDEEVRDAHDFCERYYGESESSDSYADAEVGPYKFNSPDSIGDAVTQTREARRKRRKERTDKEMLENEGLRIWVERRDRWTGTASVKKYGTIRRTASTAVDVQAQKYDTKASSESQPLDFAILDAFDVVPIAPRLLESNPIRASITPKVYSDIFQKIVVSSRTPSVPINLSDMTKALVQGWKDSEEWPPRVGLLDPLVGKKRSIASTVVNGHQGGFMDRHPHLEKGVDSVKRILHLNGGQLETEHAED